MYSIADLERISGIKAHTIRIWEKRYELLNPERTEGNHRIYSDDDLIKLLNVEQLISHGYKISKIAEWGKDKLKHMVREIFSEEQNKLSDVAYYNNEWLQSALDYDERKFSRIYKQLRSRMSFIVLWEKYIVPALQHMGQLWMTEDIAPAEEHFFSQLIRRNILVEYDRLPLPIPSESPVLLFLPPDEYHELGLLFTEFLMRKEGFYTINFGANVPIENIKKVLSPYKIKILITFIQGIKMNSLFTEFILSLESQNYTIFLNGLLNKEDALMIAEKSHIIQPQTINDFQKSISEVQQRYFNK